jgi:hypothetical protein
MPPSGFFPLDFFRSKVRVRLLDELTGHPLTGVAVTLHAEVSDGEPTLRFPVNTLVTDHVGYVSFSLARFATLTPPARTGIESGPTFDFDRVTALRIDAPSVGIRGHGLLDGLFSGGMQINTDADRSVLSALFAANRAPLPEGDRGAVALFGGMSMISYFDSAFVVNGSRANAGADCDCHLKVKGLRSIEDADDIDHAVSPGSFFAQDPVLVGEGGCQVATAAATPPRDVRLFQVVLEGPELTSQMNFSALRQSSLEFGAQTGTTRGVRLASVQRFIQRWTPLGYSLGDIRYSLPLAPGESVNLAVIEWSRQDSLMRQDAAFAQDSLQHQQRRTRDIDEAVEGTLREDQGGGSFMAGLSGAVSATVPAGGVPVNGAVGLALGGGVTHSWGVRNLVADTAQNLRDRLSQVSESLRALNSTTVIQANQSEKNVLSTRTVANHNRCHAMTVQYFEVLRNYRVELFPLPALRAVLVPFTPLAFDADTVLRWEHLLRPALLNPTLDDGFDALRLTRFGSANVVSSSAGGGPTAGTTPPPPRLPQSTGPGGTSTTLKRMLAPISRSRNPSANNWEGTNWDTASQYVAAGSSVRVKSDDDSGWISFGVGLDFSASGGLSVPAVEQGKKIWQCDDAPMYSLVAQVATKTYSVGADRTFIATEAGPLTFFVNDRIGFFTDNWAIPKLGEPVVTPNPDNLVRGLRYTVTVTPPAAPNTTDTPPISPPLRDPNEGLRDTALKPQELAKYRADALVFHVQSQATYYNRVVWMGMERGDMERMLDVAAGVTPTLFDGFDARPIAISHASLAFVAPGSADSDSGLPERPLSSQIVALPGRGVLAEAQLGQCVACEKRDATRVQEWTLRDNDRAPSLSQLVPGPKGEAPNVAQVQLGAPTLTIQAAPTAPDPTGLAAALTALTKSDAFRNMSAQAEVGALLDKLATGAFANLPEAQAAAKKAKEALGKTPPPRTTTEPATTEPLAPSGVSAAEMANRLSLLPEIKSFAKDLGMSEEDTQQLGLDTVHGNRPVSTTVPKRPTPTPIPTPKAGEVQLYMYVADAWGRAVVAEVIVDVLDDTLGPFSDHTSTRKIPATASGVNGAIKPIKGLTTGVLDLHVQLTEEDYDTMSTEVRNLDASSVKYDFVTVKKLHYRFDIRQDFDEKSITVEAGQTLNDAVKSSLAGEFTGAGAIKVVELGLKLQGSHDWSAEAGTTRNTKTQYTLRVPNGRLKVTQF